jgi:hypothetical protein
LTPGQAFATAAAGSPILAVTGAFTKSSPTFDSSTSYDPSTGATTTVAKENDYYINKQTTKDGSSYTVYSDNLDDAKAGNGRYKVTESGGTTKIEDYGSGELRNQIYRETNGQRNIPKNYTIIKSSNSTGSSYEVLDQNGNKTNMGWTDSTYKPNK